MESACSAEPWVQLSLPLLSPSLHEPPCSRGGVFVLFTEDTAGHNVPSWQLFCLRAGYRVSRSWNSSPPTVWMTRMGQETGCLQFILDFFSGFVGHSQDSNAEFYVDR